MRRDLLEMQMRACPRLTYGHLFHTFPSRLGASLEQISSHICANSVDVLKIYVLIDLNFAGQCVSRGVSADTLASGSDQLHAAPGFFSAIKVRYLTGMILPCHMSVMVPSRSTFKSHGLLFAGCTVEAASLQSVPRSKKPSLAESHPELAREWHPTKNGDRTPEHFTFGSNVRIWWLCPEACLSCGGAHEWEASTNNHTWEGMPTGCPVCSGLSVCECSSLAALRLDLMTQWDCAGNKGLDPEQISLQSHRKVSWVCSLHGPWRAVVSDRVKGSGCPQCAVQIRVENHSKRGPLKDEHPELVAQMHPTKNAHINLDKVTSGSSIKAVWVCHDRRNAPAGCTHAHDDTKFAVPSTTL